MTPEEQARSVGTDGDPACQDEARERWGGTDAWTQSAARGRQWDAEQWQEKKDGLEELEAALAEALGRGALPGGEEANLLAERRRASIDRHDDCSRDGSCPA
ncbi:TipAS antibiotic-recognition domain-containing protein [Brachybacterium sp.]|uniref:TipAS antibiotic-recognition domain-containing protein n=1 Tax=Brachybacterium sp. TaxID=1891286 RepID=UPI002ED56BB8